MHSSRLSSPESGPSSRRMEMSSSPPTDHSNTDSGYSSDPEQDSPTESEREFMSSSIEFSPESKTTQLPNSSSSSSKNIHEPPKSSFTSPTTESKPLTTKYPRIFNPTTNSNSNPLTSNRPRIRGLSPLTTLSTTTQNTTSANSEFQPRLPKAQPLSRALFNRSLSDTPHSGLLTGGKKKTSQKLIVPTKAFRTTFELGLSASELARRA